MKILLVLPFIDIKNIGSLFNSSVGIKSKGQKDVYYRALSNQRINWRNLLLLFVKRYLQIDQRFTTPKDNVKCLIFDDTDIEKTGRKIEGISKTYNHVTKHFIFGYKLLVAGYWNGSVFIPVDYILFDSWFTSMSLIKKLLSINKSVNIIGMYKYNSKLVIDGKPLTIKQLRKHRSKMKRSRSMKLYYFQYVVEIDGVKVKVFITKRGVNGAWHTIISTNANLTFIRTMEIYNIRWSIEVFFKEAKQLLGLGKSQSTNFDVQIAQTTVTIIQYLLISLKYRMEAYETIGVMFKDIKQDYIEHNLNEPLLLAIIEILSILELIIGNIDFE